MKKYYLKYKPLYNRYFLLEGKSESQLHKIIDFNHVGIEELTKKLRSNINLKKKALIHLIDLPEEGETKVRNAFWDTKVEVI